MRVLVTFAGGFGHLAPMLPVARALVDAGHTVAVSPRPALVATVEALGLSVFATGDPALDPTPDRKPLRPIDPVAEDRVLRDGFAGAAARDRAPRLLELCEAWAPDVVLCDEVDFGSMVAAEVLGLPRASVVSMPAGTFVRRDLVREPLEALRAEHGLVPDPDLAMLDGDLVLFPAPPSFRDPSAPLPATAVAIRPADPEPVGETADLGGADRPLVYASLGTVFNVESGDLFTRLVEGIGPLRVDLLLTVGRQIDPLALGPVPGNVRIERYVPQWSVLPHADVVVTHGGSGGLLGALAHGTPVLVLPLGGDQPHNAARVEALGVGWVLDAITTDAGQIGDAVATLLTDGEVRAAAAAVGAECDELPEPASAVPMVEAVAAGRRTG